MTFLCTPTTIDAAWILPAPCAHTLKKLQEVCCEKIAISVVGIALHARYVEKDRHAASHLHQEVDAFSFSFLENWGCVAALQSCPFV